MERANVVGVDLGGFMQRDLEGSRDLLRRLGAMLVSGRLSPKPASIHPLSQVDDVLQSMAERRNVGKPVIRSNWR